MQIFLWIVTGIIVGITTQSFGIFLAILVVGIGVTLATNSVRDKLRFELRHHTEESERRIEDLRLELRSVHKLAGKLRKQVNYLNEELQKVDRSGAATADAPAQQAAPVAPAPSTQAADVAPVAPPAAQEVAEATPVAPPAAQSAQTAEFATAALTETTAETTKEGTVADFDAAMDEAAGISPPAEATTQDATADFDAVVDDASSVVPPAEAATPGTLADFDAAMDAADGIHPPNEFDEALDEAKTASTSEASEAPDTSAADSPDTPAVAVTSEASGTASAAARISSARRIDAPQEDADEQEPTKPFSWEEFIGTKLLTYLGIGILVLGLASALTYSLTRMGPGGRTLTGFLCGFGILGLGFFLEPKARYILFGRILMGGGWSVLYFTAYGLYHIKAMKVTDNPMIGTGLLGAVAVGLLVHTMRYRSQAATAVALLLSYITLFLTDVSLYTHVAGIVLGALISIFAYRFRWLLIQLFGIVFLYAGYGVWLYLQGPKHLPADRVEYLWASAFLIGLWALFKVPDFAKPLDSLKESRLVPLIGLLNLAGLALVRKVTHFAFHTKGAPASALYLGGIYVLISQSMRWRGRMRVYRMDATVATVLLMVGLWCVLDAYSSCMLSWMALGLVIFLYSFWRKDRYFRDLGALVSAASTIMVLGGEAPKRFVRWLYRIGSGEMLLDLQSSLPTKAIITEQASGTAGIIGAALLFGMSFVTYLWLKRNDQEEADGEIGREQIIVVIATIASMWSFYKILSPMACAIAWVSLGGVLFQYGELRKRFWLRMVSHLVLLWSICAAGLLDLTSLQTGIAMLIGATVMYLDGFFTYRLSKQGEISEQEILAEKALAIAATVGIMVATPHIFSRFYAYMSWIGLAAFLFYYAAARRAYYLRFLSHGVLLTTTIFALLPVLQETDRVTLLGKWEANINVVNLFLAIALYHLHAFLTNVFSDKRPADPTLSAEERIREEALLVSLGNATFLIACWYSLPKITIGLVYSLCGVLFLTLGMRWKRGYLRTHAAITLLLSGFWVFTVNLIASGEIVRLSRRLLSSLPVVGLWAYAGTSWNQYAYDDERATHWAETRAPLILSFMNFAAILILLYFHLRLEGLSWVLYGIGLLAMVRIVKRARYAMQALIATAMAGVGFCNLSAHKIGDAASYAWAHPWMILGVACIFATHIFAKLFRKDFDEIAERHASDAPGAFVTALRNARLIFGMMFCAVAIFVTTSLVVPPTYALGWGVLGFALGWYGLAASEKSFRWIALALFGCAVIKILFVDVWRFTTGQKIITFISVGVALLSISFLYNRFKDKLAELLLKD